MLGSSVDLGLLADILDDPDVGGRTRWSRLEPFVTADAPGSLRFRHDLVRAGAYAGLSYRRRRHLHGRAGDAIFARTARPEDVAPALSLHFSQGDRLRETWEWSILAADRAASAAAMTEVVELLQHARWPRPAPPPSPHRRSSPASASGWATQPTGSDGSRSHTMRTRGAAVGARRSRSRPHGCCASTV